MKRHFQFSRTKPNASAATSSVLPSGFTFVDDCQGATAAVSELSTAIETALDQLSLGADLPPQLRQLVHGLDKEGSTYGNSKVNEKEPCSEWKCSRAEAQLIALAWNCTYETYNTTTNVVDTSQYSTQSEFIETPSLGSSVKGWSSTLVSPSANLAEPSEPLPGLVIAIRGSANNMDHVNNVNEPPKDVQHFINPSVSNSSKLLANASLLNRAEALAESVSQKVRQYVNAQGQAPKHILITGHSAGGAVASLLFLHFLSQNELGKVARFSCITFGSPPSVTGPIDLSKFQVPGSPAVMFNFINEFDPICRADVIYMMSLVNLVRSMYGQRPIHLAADPGSPGSVASREEKQPVATAREPSPTLKRDLSSSSRNVWPVPQLRYHHVGPRVLLLMRLHEDDILLRAVEVPSSEFEKLLFCRMAIHNGVCYSERIQLIRDGIFNGRGGWTGKEVQAPINPKCL